MSGDELTPERLDALIDGETPASTDADRDVLALAASLRDASPHASDALRARVRALPEPEPHRGGPFRRLWDAGWRGRALVAAPALAAAIAALFAVGLLGGGAGDADRVSQTDAPAVAETSTDAVGVAESTPPGTSASGPAEPPVVDPTAATKALAATTVLIPPGATAERVAEATGIVGAAGGTVAAAPAGPDDPAIVLTITLPPDRAAAALAAVAALGDTPGGIAAPAGDTAVRVLFREAPAGSGP